MEHDKQYLLRETYEINSKDLPEITRLLNEKNPRIEMIKTGDNFYIYDRTIFSEDGGIEEQKVAAQLVKRDIGEYLSTAVVANDAGSAQNLKEVYLGDIFDIVKTRPVITIFGETDENFTIGDLLNGGRMIGRKEDMQAKDKLAKYNKYNQTHHRNSC